MTNQTQQVTVPKQAPAKAVVPPVESTIISVPSYDKRSKVPSIATIDLSKAVPQLEKIIVGLSERIGLDRGGGYGSRSAEEKEAAKLIQTALNKGLEKLGSTTRIAVDGDIRPGGATAKAVDLFVELENKNRTSPYVIPSRTQELGTVVLANLAKYEPRILDKRYSVSENVTGDSLQKLQRVLANEMHLGAGTKGAEAEEINRLITTATKKDPKIKDINLAGKTLSSEAIDVLNSMLITRDNIQAVGPTTVKNLMNKMAELDKQPPTLPPVRR